MESEERSNQKTPKRRFNLLTNAKLLGFITLIGLPLTFLSMYQGYLFNKEAKPVYRVISDVIITQRSQSSKIKVYYDSVEVQNVRAVTIVLWNAGNDFLGKGAFSTEKPISIRRSTPVRILDTKLVATTRVDLKFSRIKQTIKPNDTKTDHVAVRILGDEGLEANDGATFLLLYTSPVKGEWSIDARIKGIPSGIQKAVVPATMFGWYEIFSTGVIISWFIYAVNDSRKKKLTFVKIVLLLAFGLFACATVYVGAKSAYQTITLLTPPEILIK